MYESDRESHLDFLVHWFLHNMAKSRHVKQDGAGWGDIDRKLCCHDYLSATFGQEEGLP
jgi:hypothetical protein